MNLIDIHILISVNLTSQITEAEISIIKEIKNLKQVVFTTLNRPDVIYVSLIIKNCIVFYKKSKMIDNEFFTSMS